MEEEKKKPKRKLEFNIIKNDPTDGHKGFGIGTLSLENVSPIMVDPEGGTAYIEVAAMHGRSPVERRIRFSADKSTVPVQGARTYWLVWLTVDRKEEGPYYAGIGACEFFINREERRGYKSMPEHVNNLDRSMKRKLIVGNMDDKSKKLLAGFLMEHDEKMWNLSSDELKESLLGK